MAKQVLSAAQKFAIWGKGRDRAVPYNTPGEPMVVVIGPKVEPEPDPDEECPDCPDAEPVEPERPAFLAPPKPDYVRKTKSNAKSPDAAVETKSNETSPDVVLTTSTAADELDD